MKLLIPLPIITLFLFARCSNNTTSSQDSSDLNKLRDSLRTVNNVSVNLSQNQMEERAKIVADSIAFAIQNSINKEMEDKKVMEERAKVVADSIANAIQNSMNKR